MEICQYIVLPMMCTVSFWSFHAIISIVKQLSLIEQSIAGCVKCNAIMTSLTSSHQIIDKWLLLICFALYGLLTASHITKLRLRCDVTLRNPFSYKESTMFMGFFFVYFYCLFFSWCGPFELKLICAVIIINKSRGCVIVSAS
jgi:hypothetical protein